jgi:hypothetical protein
LRPRPPDALRNDFRHDLDQTPGNAGGRYVAFLRKAGCPPFQKNAHHVNHILAIGVERAKSINAWQQIAKAKRAQTPRYVAHGVALRPVHKGIASFPNDHGHAAAAERGGSARKNLRLDPSASILRTILPSAAWGKRASASSSVTTEIHFDGPRV